MSEFSPKYQKLWSSGKLVHVIARPSTRPPASPDRPRAIHQFFELPPGAFFSSRIMSVFDLTIQALAKYCEMQEKDRDVYFNSTKRASLPIAQAKTDLQKHHEKEKSTATIHLRRVQGMENGSLRNEYTRLELRPDNTFQIQGDRNTGHSSQYTKEIRLELSRDRVDDGGLIQHANSSPVDGECINYELARNSSLKAPSYHNTHDLSSNSEQAGLKPLQDHEFKLDHNQNTSDGSDGGDGRRHNKNVSPKVQDTGNSTPSKACNPIRLSQDNCLGAHHGKKLRLRDLIMPILELDWYTSTYIPYMLYSPSSGPSFAELLSHSQSENDEPRALAPETVRPEKKARKRLQKIRSFYHHLDSSNESFVCSRAREVENSER
ncbi:hypothetical protein TGAM01_v205151 [Trichoderma gamsii]|uniref:Uncharacterized protein n=1 Tax=Trichoderma gamsii TaxID=398673 RepID=A0A2P4ZPH8_9HYPO|nr:hypothetical protein TGAM01_v205151 [Trichoderma gamsii]PON26207.1 hypothetical protein TGAM01_v205151 [Trichoderma gamsii]